MTCTDSMYKHNSIGITNVSNNLYIKYNRIMHTSFMNIFDYSTNTYFSAVPCHVCTVKPVLSGQSKIDKKRS